MSDFYNERLVKKTRKYNRCFGCREWLPTGTTAFYITGIGDSGFESYHLCIPCKEWIERNPNQIGEEWGEGDVGDARRELEMEATKC